VRRELEFKQYLNELVAS